MRLVMVAFEWTLVAAFIGVVARGIFKMLFGGQGWLMLYIYGACLAILLVLLAVDAFEESRGEQDE